MLIKWVNKRNFDSQILFYLIDIWYANFLTMTTQYMIFANQIPINDDHWPIIMLNMRIIFCVTFFFFHVMIKSELAFLLWSADAGHSISSHNKIEQFCFQIFNILFCHCFILPSWWLLVYWFTIIFFRFHKKIYNSNGFKACCNNTFMFFFITITNRMLNFDFHVQFTLIAYIQWINWKRNKKNPFSTSSTVFCVNIFFSQSLYYLFSLCVCIFHLFHISIYELVSKNINSNYVNM